MMAACAMHNVQDGLEAGSNPGLGCQSLSGHQGSASNGTAGDGCVRMLGFRGGPPAWTTHVGGGGVLCMDLHPHHATK